MSVCCSCHSLLLIIYSTMDVYLCVCIYMKWIKCHLKLIVWARLFLVSVLMHTTPHPGHTLILLHGNSLRSMTQEYDLYLRFVHLTCCFCGPQLTHLGLNHLSFPFLFFPLANLFCILSLFGSFPAESHARVSYAVWLHLQQQILHWHFHHSLPQQERSVCWKDQEVTTEYLFPRVHG